MLGLAPNQKNVNVLMNFSIHVYAFVCRYILHVQYTCICFIQQVEIVQIFAWQASRILTQASIISGNIDTCTKILHALK